MGLFLFEHAMAKGEENDVKILFGSPELSGGRIMARIVTAKEVAEYLRLNQNTIINLAVKGDLPGFKIGKSWRFDMDEIIATIEESKEKSRSSHPLSKDDADD